MRQGFAFLAVALSALSNLAVEDLPKPYSSPATERENVFEFTAKPKMTDLGNDRYEITFAVKGYCDVTVALIDPSGLVVRHIASGVLGANAPLPFQKNSLKQTLHWNGKDDLDSYPKDPGRFRLRVMLGLKPEFDKRLGITNPKSIPAMPWGICLDESGAYLFYNTMEGYARIDARVRKFDHDGNYVRTLFPPPANLPEEKLQGLGWIEYEAGRKALHAPGLQTTWSGEPGGCLPHGFGLPASCLPAVAGGRIYYCTLPGPEGRGPSILHSFRTDGSLEAPGVKGKKLLGYPIGMPSFAASPDGRWVYVAGDEAVHGQVAGGASAVFRCSTETDQPGELFAGELRKPGSDNAHFNQVHGIDCDSQGRLYVCDHDNNRIQVFLPDGKYAKTIPIPRPTQVRVHRKNGALYVLHTARVEGKSLHRVSKLTSFDNPALEFFLDDPGGLMALDSWTPKPRIWLHSGNVRIFEEEGRQLRKIVDFGEEVLAELAKAGGKAPGGWGGLNRGTRLTCDPVQEKVYYANSSVFDVRSGAWQGGIRLPGHIDDIAFDKRGYLHCHFNPSDEPGVMRLDPRQGLRECPYDYGVDGKNGRQGILPCRDQLGAKFFQDGIGVNMQGDVAEVCNIYYAPKRDDDAKTFALAGNAANDAAGNHTDGDANNFASFLDDIQRRQKTGEEVYWVRPKPGVPLVGATLWTFNRNGELRDECAVTAGGLINGVALDEAGDLYYTVNRTRLINGKRFLAGQGGSFGSEPNAKASSPFTGTLIKSGSRATILSNRAPIALDERPARPADLSEDTDGHVEFWCAGAQWLYAGASGIVPGGCSCPTMRCHTDWYKRTFVPEKYRYAIGVVDTAGNLILHIGQYGNLDSGYGPQSKVPVGGDGIAFSDCRVVSGTDNYLCFCDRGERIIVLRLNYHAEESVEIGNK